MQTCTQCCLSHIEFLQPNPDKIRRSDQKTDRGPTKHHHKAFYKCKAIPVTGRGDPQGCETSRLPQAVSSQMAVRLSVLRAGRPLPPERFMVLISVRRQSQPQSHSQAGRIRSIEKSNDLIGNSTHDLPSSSNEAVYD
jgi:hypothetical protein